MASSLERLQHEMNLVIAWRAFELRPAGAPPMPAEYRARIEAARPQLLQTAREQYGLTINPGPMGIQTRLAHRLATAAAAAGYGERMHRALLHAYWADGRDIGDEDELRAIAQDLGIDAAGYRRLVEDPAAEAAVEQQIAQAQAFGLNGVPATVVNRRYLISGAQPLPVLRRYLAQVQSMPDAGADGEE